MTGVNGHHSSVDMFGEFGQSACDGAIAKPCRMVKCLGLDGVLSGLVCDICSGAR